MFYADYHMHTLFSSDSTTPVVDMIEQSVKIGLKEIAITDHVDFDFPDMQYPFLVDYTEYNRTLQNFKELYKNKINILIGVEIGLQPHVKNMIKDLCKNHYDFIIGSTHCVDKKDICAGDYFDNKEQKEAYRRYFEDVLNSVKLYDCFNVYGHLDYINRYGDFIDKTLDTTEYMDIIEEILRVIIQKGKGIEINTSGFRYGLGHTHPQMPVLKRYKELGGEIITIGSDAHTPQYIASNFDMAYKMLEEVGFEYLTVFKDKIPKFLRLKDIY